MASESSEQLFLVDYFREFYAAVLQHRMQIERSLTPSLEEDSIQIREADILAEESPRRGAIADRSGHRSSAAGRADGVPAANHSAPW